MAQRIKLTPRASQLSALRAVIHNLALEAGAVRTWLAALDNGDEPLPSADVANLAAAVVEVTAIRERFTAVAVSLRAELPPVPESAFGGDANGKREGGR